MNSCRCNSSFDVSSCGNTSMVCSEYREVLSLAQPLFLAFLLALCFFSVFVTSCLCFYSTVQAKTISPSTWTDFGVPAFRSTQYEAQGASYLSSARPTTAVGMLYVCRVVRCCLLYEAIFEWLPAPVRRIKFMAGQVLGVELRRRSLAKK